MARTPLVLWAHSLSKPLLCPPMPHMRQPLVARRSHHHSHYQFYIQNMDHDGKHLARNGCFAGELGPSTIVGSVRGEPAKIASGSAAFNLFVIIAGRHSGRLSVSVAGAGRVCHGRAERGDPPDQGPRQALNASILASETSTNRLFCRHFRSRNMAVAFRLRSRGGISEWSVDQA